MHHYWGISLFSSTGYLSFHVVEKIISDLEQILPYITYTCWYPFSIIFPMKVYAPPIYASCMCPIIIIKVNLNHLLFVVSFNEIYFSTKSVLFHFFFSCMFGEGFTIVNLLLTPVKRSMFMKIKYILKFLIVCLSLP